MVREGNGTPLQYSCLENPMDGGAWSAAVHGVARSYTRLSDFTFTFHFHALEKEMATHSSVLAWRIPGTAEPGGLPSVGLHGVGHDWSNLAAACNCVFSECFFFLSLRGVTKFYHLILYFWMNLLFISNTEPHKHGFPKIFLVEGQWLEQIGIRQLTCQRWSFYTS